MHVLEISEIWNKILNQASFLLQKEPILSELYEKNILQHNSLSESLSYILANKLSTSCVPKKQIQNIFNEIYLNNSFILKFLIRDIKAILKRDPAIKDYLTALLHLKGFHALESYRLSHCLWNMKCHAFALYIQSSMSTKFSVDIHPAAQIGSGVMLDHATGIVIGEGAIIEDDVLIFHSVTLGGTGKNSSTNRHPLVRKGVVIGAGAKILGNIEIGLGSKIGAGAIVLQNVPSYVTVVGVPAKIVSKLDGKKCYLARDKINLLYINQFQYGDGI